ncbi:DUF3422 family protein [Shimia abyssi]|uniref:Putative membrane-anchored protein n=1 Tax=Shimia abyssi TaxID=1662395 RepID=A0A2P8FJK7_9RHOB|nr:DUF3422 domain-containing protein [Shimia abyssi]PSL21893.1 putative membrane-anchored protein [Shimia abyssi]
MHKITDHPLRYSLANELHARPFPSLEAPCTAAFLAIKQTDAAAARDRGQDLAHLIDLLDRHGAAHPQPGATHYSGEIGRHFLKWEQHTEFVTYTIFTRGLSARAFDPAEFEVFPEDWLQAAPGVRVSSALIRIELRPKAEKLAKNLRDWFVPESLAVSEVLDEAAVVATDFRIAQGGHLRMAALVSPGTDERRVGRIVQRLCEIETYKTMSMLGFARARKLSGQMGEIEGRLNGMMADITNDDAPADEILDALLRTSAELENMIAESSFRFGATGAYEAIVNQRIEVMREARYEGRQSFAEFMMRRYDPAMRTVASTKARMEALAERAMRAGELLRTKVDVARSAQNQALLESMDRRADMALRLQETVEGLSVVAISYYAVSLVSYLAYPLTGPLGLSKGVLTAVITVPVVLLVWGLVRRIKARMH